MPPGLRQVHRMPWVTRLVWHCWWCHSHRCALHMLTSTTELLPPQSDQRTYLTALQTGLFDGRGGDATPLWPRPRTGHAVHQRPGGFNARCCSGAPIGDGRRTVVYLDPKATPPQSPPSTPSLILVFDAPGSRCAASQYDFHQIIIRGCPGIAVLRARRPVLCSS